MMRGAFVSVLLFLPSLFPFAALSQVRLNRMFSDNMVLQRDKPVRVWGTGEPGKKLTVVFAKQQLSATVSTDSSWNVVFGKQSANTTPQSLVITSKGLRMEISNILIGDVWICSGQSNMEWPMRKEAHWRTEKNEAMQPLIRVNNPPPAGRNIFGIAFTDSLTGRLNTKDFYLWGGWQACDSNSLKDMSAVAYYFAKSIVEKEKVPIGLINLSIGGAPIETFISREAMAASTPFSNKLEGNWLTNDHLPVWIRERGVENVGKTVTGFGPDGPNHAYKPGFAFESGVKPLLPLPVKGVIWYQGESNSQEPERVAEYKDLLYLLIDDYRKHWQQPELPLYWVQLSSIDTASYRSRYWPEFRNEQRKLMLDVPNGGMAVCSDIGFKNNVHPTDKKSVGKRLARWALFNTYKEKVVPSGPLPLKASYRNDELVIQFQYAVGLQTADGKTLRGFSVDGVADVSATIENNTVVIHTSAKPSFVYYGWKPFTDANLVNGEKLPASTFKISVE